jgi:hypothetical protein
MASLSLLLNIFRFSAMLASFAFLNDLSTYLKLALASTVGYSFSVVFVPQSFFGVICHKCISHVPSTALLVLTTDVETRFRPVLLILCTVQYLGLWLEMYANVFTLKLKREISTKSPPRFLDEMLYLAHDVRKK